MDHIDENKITQGAYRVFACAVLSDLKKAFEDPAIQKEYREWLEDYKTKKAAGT